MSILINGNIKIPAKGKSSVLVLRDDGRCIDEIGRVFKTVDVSEYGCLIDGEALLDRFEKESEAADEHGRDFCTCFMRGNEPCAEWWAVMQIVHDIITVEKVKRGDYS